MRMQAMRNKGYIVDLIALLLVAIVFFGVYVLLLAAKTAGRAGASAEDVVAPLREEFSKPIMLHSYLRQSARTADEEPNTAGAEKPAAIMWQLLGRYASGLAEGGYAPELELANEIAAATTTFLVETGLQQPTERWLLCLEHALLGFDTVDTLFYDGQFVSENPAAPYQCAAALSAEDPFGLVLAPRGAVKVRLLTAQALAQLVVELP